MTPRGGRQHYDVVIVGTGHAGAQAAQLLRQRGFAGRVALLGEEADPPYERPPLSKDYLAGQKAFDRLLIRPIAFWAERDIALLLSHRVISIDPTAHSVMTADGMTIGYGTLIWAAGGRPRRLTCSGHDLANVHAIRTRADVDRLQRELMTAGRIVVIGGGYIGLEAAAVLTTLGHAIVLLEAAPRILARVAGTALSHFYEDEHRAHGVDLRTGVAVDCIVEADGRATGVRLADGEVIPCTSVIVGIGIVPAVEPLLAAGAVGGDGVLVDALCRTSLPDVFAIGDCAAHANRFADGAVIRLESVQNANDQAATVARLLTGTTEPYDAVPWFWSNQYDLKLQTVGLSSGHDAAVLRGAPRARAFSVVYLRNGRVVALDCVNATRDYVQGRALIGLAIDPRAVADPTTPLKTLGERRREA